jgi:hypothetical protein
MGEALSAIDLLAAKPLSNTAAMGLLADFPSLTALLDIALRSGRRLWPLTNKTAAPRNVIVELWTSFRVNCETIQYTVVDYEKRTNVNASTLYIDERYS